jgi:hypothetical protein
LPATLFDERQQALMVEFAKAALSGALADPTCNPSSQERVDEVCDFCWNVARSMVERMPPAVDGLVSTYLNAKSMSAGEFLRQQRNH